MPPRRGTPWVSHGSLLSDRIRPPSGSPQPTKSEKGKGKAKAATPEPPPRSAAVRKLDELVDGLRSSPASNESRKVTVQGAGDREGCFCQARIHALSEYTPICASSCGLVLCALQPPHRLCPHCSAPLLTPRERAALLAQLEEERARLLREEAEAREREAEEARLAQGAFPALLGSGTTGHSASGGVGGGGGGVAGAGRGARGARGGAGAGGAGGTGLGHRVLLVDSRTKRVKVESYSRPGLELESEDEDVGEVGIVDERVPPPAREVESVRVRRGPATRWVDLKGDETVKYVTPGP